MASMLSFSRPLATGIGALPYRDPAIACRDVIDIFPEFPYAPSLPNRNLLESIVYNDSEQLPGRVIRDGKLQVDTSLDLSAAMERVYLDYMEGNYAGYAAGQNYASGFHAMMQHSLPGALGIKCQVTGPVTFGMQVADAERKPIYYDPQFADVLGKMIALRARWCEITMREKTGVKKTLVVLNEPYLATLGSSVVPLDPDTVRSGWNDIASLVEGGLGIHCCSNTDWGFIMDLAPSVISLDAYTTANEFLLYSERIAAYFEQGGIVAWGIVPAEYRVFAGENADSLYDRFMAIRTRLLDHVPAKVFDAHCLITPSCGIQFADEEGARKIMRTASLIAERHRASGGVKG
jgi:hypothetical protein